MKFFGAKKRDSRRTEQKGQPPPHSQQSLRNGNGNINAENRTDVDAGNRETQQQNNTQHSFAKRRGVQLRLDKKGIAHDNNSSAGRSMCTTKQSPVKKSGLRPIDVTSTLEAAAAAGSSTKQQQQYSAATNTAKPKNPVSILHKKKQPTNNKDIEAATNAPITQSDAPPPKSTGLTFALSQPPPRNDDTHYQNRVRFMSNGSVASTEASQVHLMGLGGAGSVASSSAMSSSENRENVFERVFSQVMMEENERLNAMGMSYDVHPKSSASGEKVPPVNKTKIQGKNTPIDMDTGLEVLFDDPAKLKADMKKKENKSKSYEDTVKL